MTKTRVVFTVVIICMAAFADILHADDSIRAFSQQTLDGKTISSETLKGMPMVISVGSHW